MRMFHAFLMPVAITGALSACAPAPSTTADVTAGPLAEVEAGPSPEAHSCGTTPDALRTSPPAFERTPIGLCLVRAARQGNTVAARALGEIYAAALSKEASEGGTNMDLFGRQIMWLRAAAAAGLPQDELRLARDLDFDKQVTMPDPALAYYVRAAHHGAATAVDAIADAWWKGRIDPDRLVDFRIWLASQTPSHPALRRAANLLDGPAQGA